MPFNAVTVDAFDWVRLDVLEKLFAGPALLAARRAVAEPRSRANAVMTAANCDLLGFRFICLLVFEVCARTKANRGKRRQVYIIYGWFRAPWW